LDRSSMAKRERSLNRARKTPGAKLSLGGVAGPELVLVILIVLLLSALFDRD
jgi:hypothetical protein